MVARTLIVVRGNSGSGKSTVARAVRDRYGRGCALIEQDYLRRTVLREHDGLESTGIAPEFIAQSAAFALRNGYHVILEGILTAQRYGPSLRGLINDHSGPSLVYYFDIPYEETVRRHATRPLATEFGADQLRDWYRHRDLLGTPGEHVIGPSTSVDEAVSFVLRTSGLLDAAAVTYCPTECPRCATEAPKSP
jgi:predicted kinase